MRFNLRSCSIRTLVRKPIPLCATVIDENHGSPFVVVRGALGGAGVAPTTAECRTHDDTVPLQREGEDPGTGMVVSGFHGIPTERAGERRGERGAGEKEWWELLTRNWIEALMYGIRPRWTVNRRRSEQTEARAQSGLWCDMNKVDPKKIFLNTRTHEPTQRRSFRFFVAYS